jgi:hypothetical protein
MPNPFDEQRRRPITYPGFADPTAGQGGSGAPTTYWGGNAPGVEWGSNPWNPASPYPGNPTFGPNLPQAPSQETPNFGGPNSPKSPPEGFLPGDNTGGSGGGSGGGVGEPPPSGTGGGFWDIYSQFLKNSPGMNLPDPNKYFNEGNINKRYDTMAQNIGQRQSSAMARAGNQAGSMAGARGLMNPSGFTMNATYQASQPYVEALGNVESERAGSLAKNQTDLFNALFGKEKAQSDWSQQMMGNAFQQQGFNQQANQWQQGFNRQGEQWEKTFGQQGEQFDKTYDLERWKTMVPMIQGEWEKFMNDMQSQPGSDKIDWSEAYKRFLKQHGIG